jgi:hypothetical protein
MPALSGPWQVTGVNCLGLKKECNKRENSLVDIVFICFFSLIILWFQDSFAMLKRHVNKFFASLMATCCFSFWYCGIYSLFCIEHFSIIFEVLSMQLISGQLRNRGICGCRRTRKECPATFNRRQPECWIQRRFFGVGEKIACAIFVYILAFVFSSSCFYVMTILIIVCCCG